MRGKGRSDRGAALIEATMVLPLLLMIVFGIWSVGQAYNVYATLDHAAREAARFGAVNADDADWETEVRQKAFDEAASSPFTGAMQVCVDLVPAGQAGTCLDATDDPRTEKRAQIVVSVPDVELNFLLFRTTVTLSSRAVARWEGASS